MKRINPDKPLTTTDAALALQSSIAQAGSAMLRSAGMSVLGDRCAMWATARKVDEFRVKCGAIGTDPDVPLARARLRYSTSVHESLTSVHESLTLEQCIDDEWHRLVAGL